MTTDPDDPATDCPLCIARRRENDRLAAVNEALQARNAELERQRQQDLDTIERMRGQLTVIRDAAIATMLRR